MSKKLTIEQKIAKVFSGGETSKLVTLNLEQADRFLDYVVDESVILKSSRVVRMNTPTKDIARIAITDDILFPQTRGDEPLDANDVEGTPDLITLTTQKCIGRIKIYDDELEDNIEGEAFEDHLMRMVAKKIANQLEKVSLYSRKVANPTSLMQLFDGFLKRVEEEGNVVDVSDTSKFTDRYIDKGKLSVARKSIPTKFRSLSNKWYLPDDLTIDYENKYEATANTVNKTGAFGISFTKANLLKTDRPVTVASGFTDTLSASPAKWATTLTTTDTTGATAGDEITLALGEDKEFTTTIDTVTDGTHLEIDDALPWAFTHTEATENKIVETISDGADVLLTPDKNFIYGIQRDVRFEPERKASLTRTDFIITMRADFQVEKPDMTCLMKNVKVLEE